MKTKKVIPTLPASQIARLTVGALRGRGVGAELASAELADILEQPAKGLGWYLTPAVRGGFLCRRIAAGVTYWSLGHALDASKAPPPLAPAVEAAQPPGLSASAAAYPSIFAYARERGAAPFSASLSTDGRLTVERHGRVFAEFTDAERKLLLQAAVSVAA